MSARRNLVVLFMALWPALASAQVAPGVFTTVKSTSTAATSMCVGCPTGTTTPAANSGLTARTIVLPVSGAPSDTTLKIYQVGGALFFNGLSLATGSSISGTTGAIPKFTAPTVLGDSIMSESGGTITVAGLLSANGNLSSGTNGAEGNLIINGPAGSNRIVAWRTAGVNRWFAYATSVAESGANAGSNYRLDAYNDAGTLIGTVMLATRASLAVTLGGALTVTGASALSAGATVGTSFQLTGAAPVYLANVNNGYLFRNAADGATLMSITNAGVGAFAGDFAFAGQVFGKSGTAASPSYSITGDTNTGMFSGGADAIAFSLGGNQSVLMSFVSNVQVLVETGLFGTGNVTGNVLGVGRNASGNGAAGNHLYVDKNGGLNYTWVDAAGDLRISTAPPQEDGTPSDTSGTVVGNQTSTRASKTIYGPFTDNALALRTILSTPLYDFDYRSGAYNRQRFVGIVTEDSPTFGMDLGRSFNPVTAFGYTVAAFKAQQEELAGLRARVLVLERR